MSARLSAEDDDSARDVLTRSLQSLGFSQYEARCYVGLLNTEPQTGYAVAKVTGVPQPKVYEALRKLVSRGAAYELAGSPARFLAIPPARLLDRLEAEVSKRLSDARDAAQEVGIGSVASAELMITLQAWEPIVEAVRRNVDRARRRIYLSASARQIADVETPIRAALDRGVDVVLLCFGAPPFHDERIKLFRHTSTEGVIYRSHQARHLAVVADSGAAVWALASDGKSWAAIESSNALVIAALKGFIRHDIDMQQVYDDFPDQLVAKYGPGLEALERYRQQKGEPARRARPSATG